MNMTLVEPGVKYFFNETLKQCQKTKYNYYNSIFNLVLFIILLFVVGSIMYFTYKNKENTYEKKIRKQKEEEYLANKLHNIRQEKQRERGQMITNIPEFESQQHIHMKKFL